MTGVTASSLTFSDNGLWNPTGKPQFSFTYPLATFPKTRTQANDPNGTIYSLANNGKNYGIAIRGVVDTDGETLPVRLTTSVKWERPAMRKHSNVRPRSMPLTLTIVVSNLKPGVAYGSTGTIGSRAFRTRVSTQTRRTLKSAGRFRFASGTTTR